MTINKLESLVKEVSDELSKICEVDRPSFLATHVYDRIEKNSKTYLDDLDFCIKGLQYSFENQNLIDQMKSIEAFSKTLSKTYDSLLKSLK